MTGTGLPPQAYTKETLAEAYEWLKSQSTDIRRMASTSDTLVGLYLNAKRRKQEGFDSFYDRSQVIDHNDSAPISGEQFKKELKSLALGLNEFVDDRESIRTSPSVSPPQVATQRPLFSAMSEAPSEPPHVSPMASEPINMGEAATTTTSSSQSSSFRFSGEVQKTTSRTTTEAPGLDSVSRQKLATVKTGLNLSSETEAMRMLITLGFEKIKDILPPQ